MNPSTNGYVSTAHAPNRMFMAAVMLILMSLLVLAAAGACGSASDAETGTAESAEPQYEARIGGTYYPTLNDALDAYKDGDTVQLLRNVTVDKEHSLRVDVSVHDVRIDMSDFRMEIVPGGNFQVSGSGTLYMSDGTVEDLRASGGSTALGVELPTVRVTGGGLDLTGVVIQGNAPKGGTEGGSSDANYLIRVSSGRLLVGTGTVLRDNGQNEGIMVAVLAEDSSVTVAGSVTVNGTAVEARGSSDVTVHGRLDGGSGTGLSHSGTGTVTVSNCRVSGSTAVSIQNSSLFLGEGAALIGDAAALEIGSGCTYDIALAEGVSLTGDTALLDRRTSGALTVSGGRFAAGSECIVSSAKVSVTGGTFMGPLDSKYLAEGYVYDPVSHSVVKGITISFRDAAGVRTVYIPSGTSVTPPVPAEAEGKAFDCWIDADGNVLTSDPLTKDTSYSARYVPLVYDVLFYNYDGTIRQMHKNLEYGTYVPACDHGSREGHSFKEWNTSPDGTGTVLTPETKVLGDAEYYGIWCIDTYSIRFIDGGAETVLPFEYGAVIQAPEPAAVPEGHSFRGWNTSLDGTGIYLSEGETACCDITYHAVMAPLSFDVTFVRTAEPGFVRTVSMDWGTQIVPADPGYVYGCHFVCWNTQEDGKGVSLAQGDKVVGEVTYYAVWEADLFTVSFFNGAQSETMRLAYGAVIPEPAPVEREGFKLVQWNSMADGTGTAYVPGESSVAGDMNYYAVWQQVKFKAEFLADGQVFAVVYRDTGETVQAPASVPEKAGYVFVQWNTKADGTGEPFEDGTVMGSADMVYHAVWGIYALYEINYMDRGSVVAHFERYAGDSLADIKVDDPVRSGYSFMGWSSALPDVMPDRSMNIDAVWQKDSNVSVSGRVTFGDSMGTPIPGAVVSLIRDGLTVSSAVTDREGGYAIYDVPGGHYVLQCLKDSQSPVRWTGPVTVADKDVTADISVDLRGTSINVESENGAPVITVFGLEDLVSDAYSDPDVTRVVLRMVIDAVGSDSPEAYAIAQMAGNRELRFFDISVAMQIMKGGSSETVAVSDTGLLKIVMPFDMNGKDDLKVYRFHEGSADAFRQVQDESEAADGTYMLQDGYIVFYSSGFSLFAVGYEDSMDVIGLVVAVVCIIAVAGLLMLYFSQWGVRVRK